MGIPYYFASLLRSHKHIQQKWMQTMEVDCLGVDFNCFIHAYLRAENPVGSIIVAFHDLVTNIVRAKKVYVAFDGLVPFAKMVQQRYRRMKKADEIPEFDKNQISPGTPFMRELADTLRFMYPEIIVSDTLEPGEGEHKIFTWLRTLSSEDRKSTLIYGLDADLIVISLAQSHLSWIRLLREQDAGDYTTVDIQALRVVLPVDPETYIKMSIMCFGNDFMPNLAMFSLREDGYNRAIYYATRNDANKDERKILLKRAKDHDRRIVATDAHALEARFGCQLMDGVLDWEPVCFAFWKTYEWVYHYFTTSEVLDWEWYYPYPEAPLLQTLEDFDRPTDFTWEHPKPTMTVDQQLDFILPEQSLRKAGKSPAFPDELYDEMTETRHPWMRRYAWENDPWVSLPHGTLTSVTEYRVK